jgi:hypothetical protein
MGVNIHQDTVVSGGFELINDADSVHDMLVGGPKSPSAVVPRFYGERVMKIAMAGGTDTGGGIVSWKNPFGYSVIIKYAVLDVTTVATGACSLEAGTTATSGTTVSTNFISSQDVHSATGTFNSGIKSIKLATANWFTVSTVSGASSGLIGNLYVYFIPV